MRVLLLGLGIWLVGTVADTADSQQLAGSSVPAHHDPGDVGEVGLLLLAQSFYPKRPKSTKFVE